MTILKNIVFFSFFSKNITVFRLDKKIRSAIKYNFCTLELVDCVNIFEKINRR